MKGVRNVVAEAHGFVRSYADERGNIPADMLGRMGHMLAHCGMQNLMAFLRAHGFENPGHFLHYVEAAAAAGVTPDGTRDAARARRLLPKHNMRREIKKALAEAEELARTGNSRASLYQSGRIDALRFALSIMHA